MQNHRLNMRKNTQQIVYVTNLDQHNILSASEIMIRLNDSKISFSKELDKNCEMCCGSFTGYADVVYYFFAQESVNELFMPDQKKQQILSVFVSTDWDTVVQFGMTQEARSTWKL